MAKVKKFLDAQSRTSLFLQVEENEGLSTEALSLGCLQRIAWALERIANVLECPNATKAAQAIVRIDRRLGRRKT